MRRFSIVQPLYMSFYSRDLYRDVARLWGGSAFVYLLMLLALCWIPITGKLKAEAASYMRYEMPRIISQIPEIVISKGQATVNAEMPYTITDPDTGAPLIIIDTTGKTTSLAGSKALFLLTKDKLIARRGKKETRSYNLSEFGDVSLNKDAVSGWMSAFNDWFFLLVYTPALILSYVFRLLQVLLYAAVGIMFDRSMKAGLGYGALVRVAAVSITPAIIMDTVRASAGLDVPGWGFITFIAAMGYLYFGVAANVTARPAE